MRDVEHSTEPESEIEIPINHMRDVEQGCCFKWC